MAGELIGRCRCPTCSSTSARLTLCKSGLPALTCNACNLQVFARSDRSDMHLRALLIADAAPAPAPAYVAPEPVRNPVPAATPMPPPKPVRTSGWGVLSS